MFIRLQHYLRYSSFLLAALLTTQVSAAPLTPENAPYNINVSSSHNPTEYYGEWNKHKPFPSPDDWREIPIYHVLTDRFSDGSPLNNNGLMGGFDINDLSKRQGGDFRGLTNKLDYIKGLGFKAIWISKIFQNGYNGYHGYSPIDFTLIDDRLGTLEDFRNLVSEAHKRGIYVLVDTVVNHMADRYFFRGNAKGNAPFHLHTGEYDLVPRSQKSVYQDFKAVNYFESVGKYCPVYDSYGEIHLDEGNGGYFQSDFNHNGDLRNYENPWENTYGKIYGTLDDLRLSSTSVQQKLVAMTKALIASTDIDGLRIDTPMQVPLCFFKYWAPEVKKFAKEIGKDNFPMFGEFYSGRGKVATMIGRGKDSTDYGKNEFIDNVFTLDGGINYTFYKKFIIPNLVENINKYELSGIEGFLADNFYYDLHNPVLKDNAYLMLNFFNNHDQRRLSTTTNGFEKTKLAAGLIAFWPGIPLFYYGDEQEFSSYGTGLEGHGRETMFGSKAWAEHPAVQMPNKATRNNFDFTSSNYLLFARLLSLRNAIKWLPQAETLEPLSNNTDYGWLGYSRGTKDGKHHIVVISNFSDKVITPKLKFNSAPSWDKKPERLYDLLNNNLAINPSSDSSLSLKPFELKILAGEPLTGWEPLQITSSFPKNDSILDFDTEGSIKIKLIFTDEISKESMEKKILFNSSEIELQNINFDESGHAIDFFFKPSEGLNKIHILSGVKSLSGKELSYNFESRFWFVKPEHPVRSITPIYQSNLLANGKKIIWGDQLSLNHRCPGATYFRHSFDNGYNWSSWEQYSTETTTNIPKGSGWLNITVQYWVDGSTSFFAKDGIDRYYADGFDIFNRKYYMFGEGTYPPN